MPTFTCRRCGNDFRANALKGGAPRTYCSRACMAFDYERRLTGRGNPSWRGRRWGYKGRAWADLSAKIIARDGACVDCGAAAVLAHHLIPQRFWIDLDAANRETNLVALCNVCHVKRPEHYWVEMPDALFDAGVHSRLPPERFRRRLKPKPACAVCGEPCKVHRTRFCSYACSNKARWSAGLYDPAAITRNFGDPATARWKRG